MRKLDPSGSAYIRCETAPGFCSRRRSDNTEYKGMGDGNFVGDNDTTIFISTSDVVDIRWIDPPKIVLYDRIFKQRRYIQGKRQLTWKVFVRSLAWFSYIEHVHQHQK